LVNEHVQNGEYNLVAWYDFGADPSFLSRFYTSTGSNNWTGFADNSLDTLLADAGRQSDPALRANLYGQVQRLIMEQALILPVRDYVNVNGVSANLQGVSFDAYGWFPLLNNVTVNPG
jgi:peptide/nickel transport system substrate-binding protein